MGYLRVLIEEAVRPSPTVQVRCVLNLAKPSQHDIARLQRVALRGCQLDAGKRNSRTVRKVGNSYDMKNVGGKFAGCGGVCCGDVW
jgi:hypothetical protein